MKRIMNILAPLLKIYRYRNKKDPFKLFKNIKEENKSKSNGKNVLILPLRVSPTSNTFEGVIGNALIMRGYNVNALMCGQSINVCDNVNKKQTFSLACSICNYEQKRFSESFGINNIYYEDEVSISKVVELRKLSKEVELSKIFNYTYDNVSIGKYVEGGVARYLLISNINLTKNESLIREYFYTSLITVEATRNILKKTNPKFVLTSHGIYSTWGAAMETCIVDGYNIVVWGRGYIGQGNLVFSHNVSYLFEAIDESSIYWDKNEVTEDTVKKLDFYFKNKMDPHSGVDYVSYYSDIKEKKENIFDVLKIKKDRKRIGIYPNIPWDGKMFSATKDFPDMNYFFKAILEWANKNKNVDLIIRAHPAEAFRKGNESIETFFDIIHQECKELPTNIIYIEPISSISSYQVSEICNAALMYSSTMALEFTYVNHPVIQVGLNNVSNKGIIFDAPTKQEMFNYLDKAVAGSLQISDNMQKRIIQYADYWVNKKHVPEKLMTLEHLLFEKYNFDSNKKLKEGNFPTLDWFINRCEDGKPFIWENDA